MSGSLPDRFLLVQCVLYSLAPCSLIYRFHIRPAALSLPRLVRDSFASATGSFLYRVHVQSVDVLFSRPVRSANASSLTGAVCFRFRVTFVDRSLPHLARCSIASASATWFFRFKFRVRFVHAKLTRAVRNLRSTCPVRPACAYACFTPYWLFAGPVRGLTLSNKQQTPWLFSEFRY